MLTSNSPIRALLKNVCDLRDERRYKELSVTRELLRKDFILTSVTLSVCVIFKQSVNKNIKMLDIFIQNKSFPVHNIWSFAFWPPFLAQLFEDQIEFWFTMHLNLKAQARWSKNKRSRFLTFIFKRRVFPYIVNEAMHFDYFFWLSWIILSFDLRCNSKPRRDDPRTKEGWSKEN